jgi:hypothetical protein
MILLYYNITLLATKKMLHPSLPLSWLSPHAFTAWKGDESVALVHERDMPQDLSEWLDKLPADKLPDGRVLISPSQTLEALEAIFVHSKTPSGLMRFRFARDVAGITQRFSELSDSPYVDLRLEAIRHDHCWRFHRDNVHWRLLTTYRGTGTEWVEPHNAERALSEQRDYSGPLCQLSRFSIGLLKGLKAGINVAALHRSPPMPQQGNRKPAHSRLLLCLNVPSDASPDPWSGSL